MPSLPSASPLSTCSQPRRPYPGSWTQTRPALPWGALHPQGKGPLGFYLLLHPQGCEGWVLSDPAMSFGIRFPPATTSPRQDGPCSHIPAGGLHCPAEGTAPEDLSTLSVPGEKKALCGLFPPALQPPSLQPNHVGLCFTNSRFSSFPPQGLHVHFFSCPECPFLWCSQAPLHLLTKALPGDLQKQPSP